MRALVYDGTSVKYRQAQPDPVFPRPAPPVVSPALAVNAARQEEALLQVHLAGICQTDLEIAKGYMNFHGILGHEFVGTVVKCADKKWIGKRVVAEINCVCGRCDMCQSGLSSHCRQRTVIGIHNHDGAFADFLTVPIRNLHLVPDNVSNEEAVFVEPLAAAMQVLLQCKIDSRTRVTVLGDGRLGQLLVQVIARTGCKPMLVGRHPNKLAIADRLGIRTHLESQLESRRDQDVVIDCTGRSEGFEKAVQLVRPRGTIVLKTTVAAGKPLNLAPVVIDELTILGSRCGNFREALAALAQKQVDVTCLISRRIKLENGEQCFASAGMGDALKVLLTMEK